MKTYSVQTSSGPVLLSGLTDGVKENLEDIVQARERKKLGRQLKKGLIDEATFAIGLKSVEAIAFDSIAVLNYAMMEPEGQRQLIRELLLAGGANPPTRAVVDEIHAAYQDPESDTHQTFVKVWGDAYPKKATRGSGLTAPNGGPVGEVSCAASPSTCQTMSAAG